MAQVKNISPLGDLDVPELGTIVLAGATVDVPNDRLEAFLAQPSNWESVGNDRKKYEQSKPNAEPTAPAVEEGE